MLQNEQLFGTSRRGILGNRLTSLRHGVLRQLTGKKQTNSGLNLSARQCRLVVVTSQVDGFVRQSLEDIVHERVHDGHRTFADTHIGVYLLQHTVDVRRVRLQSSSLTVIKVSLRLRSLCTLARSFRHVYETVRSSASPADNLNMHLPNLLYTKRK